MPRIMNVTRARQQFTNVVRTLDEEPVYLTVRGEPKAVLVRYDVFEALLEKIEDLEDSLTVLERRGGPTRDLDEIIAELEEGVPSPA